MYVFAPPVYLVPLEGKKGHQVPGTEVRYGGNLPVRCWKSNLGPVQKQVLLTADSSLQPWKFLYIRKILTSITCSLINFCTQTFPGSYCPVKTGSWWRKAVKFRIKKTHSRNSVCKGLAQHRFHHSLLNSGFLLISLLVSSNIWRIFSPRFSNNEFLQTSEKVN